MEKVIGIDLGGTSIVGGIVNEKGKILYKVKKETGKGVGSKEVLRRISIVIQELLSVDDGIVGIGIGSAGFIDIIQGKVLSVGGNIEEWSGTEIKGELAKVFPESKIIVENDANVAAVCEGWIGAGRDFSSFVMLTLGTGLGGSIYTKNNGIWRGHNYQGAELGHTILYPHGKQCYCGQKGCVEEYISGTAIENSYYDITGSKKDGREIFNLYFTDNKAKIVIDKFSDDLGIFIGSLKNIIDPEGIVIGGGVINSKEYWWDQMIKNYKNHVNNPEGMEIVPAVYLNDAGVIGAGKIALDYINK